MIENVKVDIKEFICTVAFFFFVRIVFEFLKIFFRIVTTASYNKAYYFSKEV